MATKHLELTITLAIAYDSDGIPFELDHLGNQLAGDIGSRLHHGGALLSEAHDPSHLGCVPVRCDVLWADFQAIRTAEPDNQ